MTAAGRAVPGAGRLTPLAIGAVAASIALLFLAYPLASAVLGAFVRNGQPVAYANLTLANFERFLISASYQRALWHSLIAGAAATLLATTLSLPMAYALARVAMPLRATIMGLSVLPLISPPFIGAYAWIILLGNNGILNNLMRQWLGFGLPSIYGFPGVVLALALSYFPYVFLVLQGALAAVDTHIEEAATVAGASRWRVLRTVTLPMILPATAAGMLIVFIKAIGDFGVPSILGGEYQVLPTLIYYQIHGFFNLNAAAAIAMVNVGLTLLALAALGWINRRRAVATVTGTARSASRPVPPALRCVAIGYVWLVLVVANLPQVVTVLYSFSERWGDTLLPSVYGLENYRRIAGELAGPAFNSVVLAGAATLVCLVFGAVTAQAVARGRIVGRWAVDLVIMVPFVLPGLVIGVAYLVAFNEGPLVLTGTATILVLAYFTRRVAFVYRSANAAILQLDHRLEEASSICGASWATTMRRITLPLIAPALLAGGILVFATLIGEISVTVLLYSAKWKTLTIAIYEYLLGNDIAKASALGTVTIILTLALVAGASRLAGRNMADMFR
ncbi:MAG: iron ABC transporter permease [Alphaproteobacteria bacterium]|nr:iron ABC transporter permease [Alphaproteobacteria bacterium]